MLNDSVADARRPRRQTWIWGYGSLVWRPEFEYAERRPAWAAGWVRRFWQGSTDHRGRPGAPGRVVTLAPEAGAVCHGLAYRLEEAAHEVLALLDRREKGGYQRLRLVVHFADGARIPAYAYVATPANPNYLGAAPLAAIAAQIRSAAGPSGRNDEYVFRLAAALRELNADDEHVFAVDALLRETPAR